MLYFICVLRQIRFLLCQRNNSVNKQFENSMMIPVAEKLIKKLKVFQCFVFFNYFLPVLWTELFASSEYIYREKYHPSVCLFMQE